MKNFSAKTANFQNLKVKDANVISEINLGTAPNQIPLNKDLGSLAYQDAVNLDDVSADMLELRAIAAEISDSAVDVFVYDTSRDSDGGAWRKRTQHTSWYNEELNTATRGARREFPAVAVIVAESGNVKKLKIYDGDDPDLSLWMSFEASGIGSALGRGNVTGILGISSVCMLNGLLCVTGLGSSGNIETLCQISFIDDVFWQWHKYGFGDAGISERNEAHSISSQEYRGRTDEIINVPSHHDVAMTVLPNAPIDQNTGLPTPTIAVATDGGVSVIKDDGTVISTSTGSFASYTVKNIDIQSNGNLFSVLYDNNTNSNYGVAWAKNYADISGLDWTVYANWNNIGGFYYPYKYASSLDYIGGNVNDLSFDAIGSVEGLTKTDKSPSSFGLGMTNFISSKYNTGWMPGDIKLATLSDTTVETIGESSDNLVTNGGFSTDSDWTKGAGWTISGTSALHVAGTAGDIDQSVSLLVGQAYTIIVNITASDFSEFYFKLDDGDYIQIEGSPLGVHSYTFIASESIQNVGARGGVNWDGTIDSISVRATTELITNGDFSNGTTGWTENNGGSLSVNASKQLVVTNGVYGFAQQNLSGLTIGKKYVFSYDVIMGTSNEAKAYVRKGDGMTEYLSKNYTSDASGSITFIATQTDHPVRLLTYSPNNGETSIWDNISVRPAEEDRSVNNNGLQIVGAINKTPVAPGADLVAYSGFSEYNYLVQPYNEDLNFGAGDFCVMAWVRTSMSFSDYQTILDFGLTASGSRRHLAIAKDTGELYMAIQGSNTMDTHSVSVANNSWCHCVATVVDGTISFYINGIFAGSNSSLTLNNLDDSIGLRVGLGIDDKFILNGSVSLLRVSATAPTDAQIAKIYRDEKALFQDGAQATLYGTSDAVTALAYDDSNQLLHVGTASGRSDFRGLARVNNTTTAISNSISAAEGTIIQN